MQFSEGFIAEENALTKSREEDEWGTIARH